MKNVFVIICMTGMLTACEQLGSKPVEINKPVEETVRPEARPGEGGDTPPATAETVEEFDTTTTAERKAAAAAPKEAGERELGRTIASLGDPTDPGFWLETPFVSKETKGRVVYPVSGESVAVVLKPIDGADGAGSRISLPAMRLLGAPLTSLPELIVYAE